MLLGPEGRVGAVKCCLLRPGMATTLKLTAAVVPYTRPSQLKSQAPPHTEKLVAVDSCQREEIFFLFFEGVVTGSHMCGGVQGDIVVDMIDHSSLCAYIRFSKTKTTS